MVEIFHIRKLLWEEIKPHIKASEIEELRFAIGSKLLDENEQLRLELIALVEILTEFQQQNDSIRDALLRRPRIPEPPGRTLLMDKIKMLVESLQEKTQTVPIICPHQKELLDYVLSNDVPHDSNSQSSTPLMYDISSQNDISLRDLPNGVILRPVTSSGIRPQTAGSRPVSRGSTVSISSAPAILENPEFERCLNVDQIDCIKADIRDALDEERRQLLEDIDFIQDCLEMEKDLIDNDTRHVSRRVAPSLADLNDLSKSLEKSLHDQEELKEVQSILNRAQSNEARRGSKSSSDPLPSPILQGKSPKPPPRDIHEVQRRPSLPPVSSSAKHSISRTSSTKVLKIRHTIQEVRDEPFLT